MLPKRKVDIIVPNYNYGHFLEECIQKIHSQTFSDFRVIILDNGSTDNSHELVKEWQTKDERIQFIINEKNLGVAGSLWKGYALADAEYTIHMGADDRIEPDYLKTTVEALDKNPEAAVAYTTSNMVSIDANMKVVGQTQRYVPHYESGLYNELIYLFIHSHATDYQLVRKAYADEFGSWEGCWNEESGLYHKISSKYPFYYIKTEKPLIWSFKHASQVSKQWNKNGIYFQKFVNGYDYVFKSELFPMPIKLLAKAVEYARFTGQPLAKIAEMMLNTRDGVFRNSILPVANEFLYLVADLILSQFHIRNNPNALQQNAAYGTVNEAVQILGFLLQKQKYQKAQQLLDYHHISVS